MMLSDVALSVCRVHRE